MSNKTKLLLSIFATFVLMLVFSITCFAGINELQVGDVVQSSSEYTTVENPDFTKYIVTSVYKYNLSDAVTEYVIYTNNEAGTSQSKINLMVVDTRDGDAKIATGYGNLNPKEQGWTMVNSEKQAEIYEKATGENVVGVINSSWFDVRTGEPTGMLIMNGVVQRNSLAETWVGAFSDGSVNLFKRGTTIEQAIAEQSAKQGSDLTILDAVDGFSAPLVWDGQCVMADDRGNYPRSAVGVTEDGVTVLCQIESGVSDSVGYDVEPMSALLIKLGCVRALRLDEGGSSTFCSKRPGETEVEMRNTSVQGTERNISGTILVIAKTGLSDENVQTSCDIGEHNYLYNDDNNVFTCSECDYSSAKMGSDYAFSGWAKSTSDTEYFFIGSKKMKNYSYLDAVPTYFDPTGIARSGEYVINGEKCIFERGVFVKCTTADVLLAGYLGLEDKLYDIQFVLYKDGRLILTGSGQTGKFDSYSAIYPTVPWNSTEFRNAVKSIYIGKDIIYLNKGLFRSFFNLKSITFEQGSKCRLIGVQCLYYDSPLTTIVLPDGFVQIDTQAFAERTSLTKLYIPASVKAINGVPFEKCSNLTLYLEKGSVAEQYAKSHSIPYKYGRICDVEGHSIVKSEGVAPTCTQNGYSDYEYCSLCGKVTTEKEVILALGHTIAKTEGVAPTCTTDGTTESEYCTVCGAVISEKKTIPAIGHSFGEGVEKDGELVFTCSACGYSYSENKEVVIAYGNFDGKDEISVSDARIALRIAIKLDEETEENKTIADVDADGNVTVSDARLILRAAIKLDKPEEVWKVYTK